MKPLSLNASQKMKKTPIGEIPVEWEVRTLGALCKALSGGTPSKDVADYWNGDVPWFSAKDLKSFYLHNSQDRLTEKGAEHGPGLVPANTILVLVRGMTLDKDFPVCITTKQSSFNQDLKALQIKSDMTTEFLAYALIARKNYILSLVDHAGHGTGRLETDTLLSVQLPVPPSTEQEKITNVLLTWERRIDRTARLLEAKRRLKAGLMQQLLTGKRRFPRFGKTAGKISNPWTTCHIGDIACEISTRNSSGESLPVLSCTKYNGLVDSAEYFGRRVFSADTSNYRVVRRGQFAYATNHIEEGSIGLLEHADGGLVSPIYTVFETTDAVLPVYLYKLLKTEYYRRRFAAATHSSVNRRGSLRWSHFAKIRVTLPPLDEQRRLVDFIELCEREIELLEQKLKALRKQKKGLMQKLLTGKVRVRG